MSCWFPQVIWLAIYFQKIFQAPRIVQIITVSGRYTASEGLNRWGAKECQDLVCLSQLCCLQPPYAIVCSARHNRQRRGVGPPELCQAYLHLRLFAGAACPALESDWPLALDWNWLHKGYNNERLLIFWQWQWRSVKGWDTAVTRTTRFYISVLSSSQMPKSWVGPWSQRYCVF